MRATAENRTIDRVDRTYRATAGIVGLARMVVRDQAREWGLAADRIDTILSVCSELVTNAVAVSRATDLIKVRCERFPDYVELLVWDASPETPAPRTPDLSAEPDDIDPEALLKTLDDLPDAEDGALPAFGGWGLNLVMHQADATGAHWVAPVGQAGKWVYARFTTPHT